MDKATKEVVVAELRDLFSSASAAVLIDSRGLQANKVVELRKELNKAGSKMKVVKNTLAKIAADGTPFESFKDQFVETRALIFSSGDPVEQAKVVSKFAEENDQLQIKAGLLASAAKTSLLSKEEVEALAKLPAKEELIAKLLFLLNAPITQFVRTLNEVPASFVRAVSAIADSKQQPSS